MGRRRRSKFKAWPLLILLALVYWAKEHLGLREVSDVESLSESALPVALILFVVAAIWLVVATIKRRSKNSHDQEE